MKPDEIMKAPKIFCESINIVFTPEYFLLGVSSGDETDMYALTPEHAKRMHQYLTHQINEFEKQQGNIKASWNPNIVSPVQRMNPPTPLS